MENDVILNLQKKLADVLIKFIFLSALFSLSSFFKSLYLYLWNYYYYFLKKDSDGTGVRIE